MSCVEFPYLENCICPFGQTRVLNLNDTTTDTVAFCCGGIDLSILGEVHYLQEEQCRLNNWTPNDWQQSIFNHFEELNNMYQTPNIKDNGNLECPTYIARARIYNYDSFYCVGRRPTNQPNEQLYSEFIGCYQNTVLYYSRDQLLSICPNDSECIAGGMGIPLERTDQYPNGECGFLSSNPPCGECPVGYECNNGICSPPGDPDEDEEPVEPPQEEDEEDEEMAQERYLYYVGAIFGAVLLLFLIGLIFF